MKNMSGVVFLTISEDYFAKVSLGEQTINSFSGMNLLRGY